MTAGPSSIRGDTVQFSVHAQKKGNISQIVSRKLKKLHPTIQLHRSIALLAQSVVSTIIIGIVNISGIGHWCR